MNRKKITAWSVFRDFVNSKRLGTFITRREILLHVNSEFLSAGLYQTFNGKKYVSFSDSTIDASRNMASGAGFLEKTDKDGIYKIAKKFPEDYTVTKLRKDYERRLH